MNVRTLVDENSDSVRLNSDLHRRIVRNVVTERDVLEDGFDLDGVERAVEFRVDSSHALEDATECGISNGNVTDRFGDRQLADRVSVSNRPVTARTECGMRVVGCSIREYLDRRRTVTVDEPVVTGFDRTPTGGKRLRLDRLLLNTHTSN